LTFFYTVAILLTLFSMGKQPAPSPPNQEHEHRTPQDRLRESPWLLRECPVCKKAYQKDHMRFLKEYEGSQLIHMTCKHCTHALLLLVMISPFGISSMGMMTDLHAADVVRLHDAAPIDHDDVLDLHVLLSDPDHAFEHAIIK